MNHIEDLKIKFIKKFNKKPVKFFFAPGRINFIGEHIDYNGGKVLPFAIERGIYALVSFQEHKTTTVLHLYSEIDQTVYDVDLDKDIDMIKKSNVWIRYPIGVIHSLRKKDQNVEIWIYYYSNLPTGSGLSSSASIEVLTGFLWKSCIEKDSNIDRTQLALLCQKVENEFIGVQCGIMDQFAVAKGKENHLILLDTHTLEYEYLYFLNTLVDTVVINSNVPRTLSNSKYNERRNECNLALAKINTKEKFSKLVDVPEELALEIPEENIRKRALHVIRENQRVKEIVSILKQNTLELQKIGNLLYESHESLKNLYEVSCKELDLIIEESRKIEGVIGARMTGAGFGGCAIAIVKKEYYENYEKKLYSVYKQNTNLELEIFKTKISDGVKEWNGT